MCLIFFHTFFFALLRSTLRAMLLNPRRFLGRPSAPCDKNSHTCMQYTHILSPIQSVQDLDTESTSMLKVKKQ